MVSNFARITRAVAFCLTASLFAGAVQAADPVKIGFAGPMTGPVSAFGNEIKRGIDMCSALLQVDDLHVSYGPVRVLDGASLTVAPGEVVTILGSNGAGKTTLLRSIAGLVRHQKGHIQFDGVDIGDMVPFLAHLEVGENEASADGVEDGEQGKDAEHFFHGSSGRGEMVKSNARGC